MHSCRTGCLRAKHGYESSMTRHQALLTLGSRDDFMCSSVTAHLCIDSSGQVTRAGASSDTGLLLYRAAC